MNMHARAQEQSTSSKPYDPAYILRQMRATAGCSQQELSFRLGISQRHLSFVECGRSRPSRDLVIRWARETGASAEARNAALHAAGFSSAYLGLEADEVDQVQAFKALSEMLVAHEPCPGIIFSADWMIAAINEGGQWLCTVGMPGFLASMTGPPSQMDMIAAMAHPDGLLSRARNPAHVGFTLLRQLRAEEMARPSLKPRVDMLEASLIERYHADPGPQHRCAGDPYVRLAVDTEVGSFSFLLVQTVFGLPQSITADSLRTELWFPTDEDTRRLMATRGQRRSACA